MGQTLGERLNNPGNIERNHIVWDGQDTTYRGRFCKFTYPVFGLRAMAILLWTYWSRRGLKTPRKIINRYAPPSENNTQKYIDDVCAKLSCWPDQEIDLTQQNRMIDLMRAMVHKEQGRVIYPDDIFIQATLLASAYEEARTK